jgi:hypothetical protein
MDFGLLGGIDPPEPLPGVPDFDSVEPARWAMGDTRRYAERMQLSRMTPRGDLSSTGYGLADPGEAYLVLQPSEAEEAFTVTLAPGTYAAEWFSVLGRETRPGEDVTAEAERARLSAPFATPGPVVVYLKRRGA